MTAGTPCGKHPLLKVLFLCLLLMEFHTQLATCLTLLPGVLAFYAIVTGHLKVLLMVKGHISIGRLKRNDISRKRTRSQEDRKQKAHDNADADQTFHLVLTFFLTRYLAGRPKKSNAQLIRLTKGGAGSSASR